MTYIINHDPYKRLIITFNTRILWKGPAEKLCIVTRNAIVNKNKNKNENVWKIRTQKCKSKLINRQKQKLILIFPTRYMLFSGMFYFLRF